MSVKQTQLPEVTNCWPSSPRHSLYIPAQCHLRPPTAHSTHTHTHTQHTHTTHQTCLTLHSASTNSRHIPTADSDNIPHPLSITSTDNLSIQSLLYKSNTGNCKMTATLGNANFEKMFFRSQPGMLEANYGAAIPTEALIPTDCSINRFDLISIHTTNI